MIKKFTFTLFISIAVLSSFSCSDSTTTEPADSEKIYQIVKSSNNGDSWNLIASLPTLNEMVSIRLNDISCDNDGNIYVATTGNGVYKIKNDDYSISQLINGLIPIQISNYNIYSCGAILCSNDRIIAGSSDLQSKGGIFTLDKDIFQSKFLWNQYSIVYSLYKNLNGELYAGCRADLLSSTDNGNSWQSLTEKTEDGFENFYGFFSDKYANIFACTQRGVYYSKVGENIFKKIGLSDEAIAGIDINSKGWIYASTEDSEMFVSKDHGSSWQKLNYLGPYPGLQARCIYINKNDYILIGTEDGIYRSKDNGDSWESVGIRSKYVIKIVSDLNGNLVAGTYRNEIYCSMQ